MASEGNNANGKYAHLRDSFFTETEKEHFDNLLKNSEEKRTHEDMLKEKNDNKYRDAISLIERAEAGEFNEEEMETAEHMISHLLAGIVDLQKVNENER